MEGSSYLPITSRNSMSTQYSGNKLRNLIFDLIDKNGKLKPASVLESLVRRIIVQLKILKGQNRLNEITGICNTNDKLRLLSQVLKMDYFKYNQTSQTSQTTVNEEAQGESIFQLANMDLQRLQSFTPLNYQSHHMASIGITESNYNKFQPQRIKKLEEEYYLRVEVIKLFVYTMINDKMLTFINSLHVPLYIYVLMLGPEGVGNEKWTLKQCFLKRLTEKGLKFIYQYIKVSKSAFPKIYCYLIKNLYLEYYLSDLTRQSRYQQKKKRILQCFEYIFESMLLILKKNLVLAAECGILATLYHKCMQGIIDIGKIEVITLTIINYCIEEKNRKIIHNTIDLGKTFAIFTNVDKVQWAHQKQQNSYFSLGEQKRLSHSLVKNKASIQACAVMIEMYLSNWPTLLYFLNEKRTLTSFISSLKRKEDKELQIIQQIIFNKILMRCLNYNRKKLVKSNNIFSTESNYLILRSLILLHYFNQLPDFKELVLSGNRMPNFRECFIDVMLDYFTVREEQIKNKQTSKLLVGNIKNINYYKHIGSQQKYQTTEDEKINNNIESFCSQSLLPFQFNHKQLKHYLQIFIHEVKDHQQLKAIYRQIQSNEKNGMKLAISDVLNFYKIAIQSCKQITWKAEYLHISKYISNITGYLLQFSEGAQKISIIDYCRNYLKQCFHMQNQTYFHYLNINLLDDIGRYFASDPELIKEINPNIAKLAYAYKISRILLHIDSTVNSNYSSTDIQQKIYGEVCKYGSKALILQVIQIIKYSFEQNDNIFRPQHLKNVFGLITNEDEDIVYSIIQFSEEFIHKSRDLEHYIKDIKLQEVKKWKQRINYLFLYYESTIRKIQKANPSLLKEQLYLWLFNNTQNNRKKQYYNFLNRELKKYAQHSIQDGDCLNLNFDPNNYRKLIFLPWNIKINDSFYPIFIQYKNLQDKLKLKIFMNMVILKQVLIEQLYIGDHDYSAYIKPNITAMDYEQDNKLRLTLQEIKKEHLAKLKPNRMTMSKGEVIYFVIYEDNIYKIERININIPLSLDTYRPILYPINFVNLLCSTRYGYQFLKKQKFIEHCLEVIQNQEAQQKYKDHLKGALVSIGTLCGSSFMHSDQKIKIYHLISKKFLNTTNYQIQQIYIWIFNILIKKDQKIREINLNMNLIQTKKCNWICFPNIEKMNCEKYTSSQRISTKIKKLKEILPEKPQSVEKCIVKEDVIYRYFYLILCDRQHQISQKQKQIAAKQLLIGNIESKTVIQNVVRYISAIDFKPQKIKIVMNQLGSYFMVKFDSHFFYSKSDKEVTNVLQLP